jgi:hypothetical protein
MNCRHAAFGGGRACGSYNSFAARSKSENNFLSAAVSHGKLVNDSKL